MIAETEKLLTKEDLMALVQVTDRRTIRRLIAIGQLPRPCIKSGRVERWRKVDVDAHLAKRMLPR